jgi:pyruvate dehydrogenase E2 component (dihydrolipoamide acetyltransferase)
MEVESPADGVIEQLIGEIGVAIEIGKPVLIMQTDTEVMSFDFGGDAPLPEAPAPAVKSVPVQAAVVETPVVTTPVVAAPIPVVLPPMTNPQEIRAVPKARAIANDRGIDLRTVAPTGPDHTITVEDVGGNRLSDDQIQRQAANKALIAKGLEMTRGIPQISFSRNAKSASAELTSIIAGWARVLRTRPDLNISPKDGSSVSHVGVAVIIESKYGSALPVFRDPDLLSTSELADLFTSTAKSAHNGKVPLAMLSGATTAIFDLTKYKMNSSAPVLFPNQVTSLTIGENFSGEKIISLTIDLRYLDFYDGAQLLDSLISAL